MVLVPGVKDKGDVLATGGIRQAREMGERIRVISQNVKNFI